ncbi:hypothetical protein PV664_35835 [Streptomyces sp. ME01-18a]|uniref:hypothetical protein n=1 Tax=Streptomyces sp. ME01-18a TaxID=3028669 RepID=UPI0029BA009A|nr:hypothetical protein [Streptomyces sp. ME01-18a]MDX3434226.1 hypothetical protein [Streptomyces sp. ME01-18a]
MKKLIRLALLGSMTALVAGTVTSVPASAVKIPNCITAPVAEGCFEPDGDDISVADDAADGKRTVVKWVTDYGRSGECQNTLGANTRATCYYDMQETGKVQLTLGLQNGDNGAFEKLGTSPWFAIG